MMPPTLFIVGNGFDLMHDMLTRYSDYRNWLLSHDHLDVMLELESVFGRDSIGQHDVLWKDFETALGMYDFEKAAEWDMESLFIDFLQVGSQDNHLFLDVSLNNIVGKSFTEWVRSIEISDLPKLKLPRGAKYLTFNYTDTLELLYGIPINNVLHIHGRIVAGEDLIVGHRHLEDPLKAVREGASCRLNNERIQHICDMNELYKPIEEIIDRNVDFFDSLSNVTQVNVIGHSCNEIDALYFEKVAKCISAECKWTFHYYTVDDLDRMKCLVKQVSIVNVDYEKCKS